MTTTQQDKPGGKPRQRNRKSEPRKQKGEQREGAARDSNKQEAVQPAAPASGGVSAPEAAAAVTPPEIESAAAVTPAEMEKAAAAMVETVAAEVDSAAAEVAMVPEAEAPLVGEVLPPVPAAATMEEPVDSVSLQTIANALADYARTSLQDSGSFIEKFMRVRSFDKAIELQNEFARQACSNFIAESQKVCVLYARWARQAFRPWEVAAAKLTQAGPQAGRRP